MRKKDSAKALQVKLDFANGNLMMLQEELYGARKQCWKQSESIRSLEKLAINLRNEHDALIQVFRSLLKSP